MITTSFIDRSNEFVALVENTESEKYLLTSSNFNELLSDWFEKCEYVPSNDSPVYFAIFKGELIDTSALPTFETLIGYISSRYGYSLAQSYERGKK